MKLKSIKLLAILVVFNLSTNLFAAINSKLDPQMVNLNIQIKTKKKTIKSDLAIPYYQTAELEKKINNKNYYFELNPKKGLNPNEVDIEVKLFNKQGSKVIAKKEVIAYVNKESSVSMKGLTFKLTPEI